MSRLRAALALAAVLLAAPAASAAQSLVLGEALAPSFDAGEALLGLLHEAGPPALRPLTEAGLLAVAVLRVAADATVVGATDGDLGTHLGTPDAVHAEADGAAVERVAVPATPVEAGGQAHEVVTPEAQRTFRTPAVHLPGRTYPVPAQRVDVDTPAIDAPAVVVAVPPLDVETPSVALPRLEAQRPGAVAPGVHQGVDFDALDLNVQEVRGTLYLGPHQVPYRAGPFDVGEDQLPEQVPRQWRADVEGREVLQPEAVVLHQGGEVVPGRRADLPGQEVPVREGSPLLPALHADGLRIPAFSLGVPAFDVAPQERTVRVAPHRVATPPLPGVATEVPEVVLVDQGPDVPGAQVREDPFGDLDHVGYFGYGQGGDSSLYPFLCTGTLGCLHASDAAGPWASRADMMADGAAAVVDGEVRFVVGQGPGLPAL